VDLNTEQVFGTTDPGATARVGPMVHNGTNTYGYRWTVSDANGNWMVDFSQPGPGPDEQDTLTWCTG